MSKPKVFLHVGAHKTGTTAIQNYCASHRDYLFGKGIFYPNYYPFTSRFKEGHHSLAHGFANKDNNLLAGSGQSLIDLWEYILCLTGNTMLISSESMYRHLGDGDDWRSKRASYLNKVAEAFDRFEVIPVVVYRRPDDFVKSLFQEEVKSTVNVDYNFERYIQKKRLWLDYEENSRIIESVFGRIKILVYEQLCEDGGLVGNFMRELFGDDVEVRSDNNVVRKSWSPEQTYLKNFANSYITSHYVGRKINKWIDSEECQKAIDSAFDGKTFDIWDGRFQKIEFYKEHLSSIERFCERRFGAVPDSWKFDESKCQDVNAPILTEKLKNDIINILYSIE